MPNSFENVFRFSSRCLRLTKIILAGTLMHLYLSTEERMNGAGKGNLSCVSSRLSGISISIILCIFSYQFFMQDKCFPCVLPLPYGLPFCS